MYAKLNIKGLAKSVKDKVKTTTTNMVKKKTNTGCKSCGKNR